MYVARLDWLAKNPRFAMHVGARCREMTSPAVAERLHDSTGKDLDTISLQRQVARTGRLAPRAIGVDEIAIRKGHDDRRSLTKRLKANQRLNTAYRRKASVGQRWDYQTESGARAFFRRWTQRLKWPRLTPYETVAAMIDRHWDGIASYCHPENQVSLGLVAGLNNKIRVLQRRAYGYRDEDYLTRKIVAAFLPPLTRREETDPL